MRILELAAIQIKRITIKDDHMTIFKSKTDKHRTGNTIFISSTHKNTSPVTFIRKISRHDTAWPKPRKLLNLSLGKNKVGYRALGNYPLTYSTIRKHFLTYIKAQFTQRPTVIIIQLTFTKIQGCYYGHQQGVDIRLVGKHGLQRPETLSSRIAKKPDLA